MNEEFFMKLNDKLEDFDIIYYIWVIKWIGEF